MADQDKTEPKSTEPSVADLQAQLNEITKKLTKREEDMAYLQKENNTLKEAKKDLDKRISDDAGKGDPDAMKRIRDEHQNQLADAETKFKEKEAKLLKELKQERVIAKGIQKAAALFNDDALELVQMKIERFADYEDGEIVIRDEKGEIRYSEENKRQKMGIDEFLKEVATKIPSIARATGQQGVNQNGTHMKNSNGEKQWTLQEFQNLSPKEQREAKISPEQADQFLKQLSKIN